ncbi:MAG: transporter related [Clostridia bacterium]|nr:transporter related [Clostridia bacterium]
MENKDQAKKAPKGPFGGGPMGGMSPADKAKDFKGTFKRLVNYIGKYNKAVIAVLFVLALGTVLSVVSPKILGKATTELGNNIMQKMVYSNMRETLDKLPTVVKNNLPENATVQTLIDMKVVPEEYVSKIPEVAKAVSLNKEPKINFEYISEILLVIVGLYVVSALFTYIANRTMAYIAQKVTYNLRKEMDEKLDRLPLKFFDKHTHGEILSRVTNDIDSISTMLQQSLVQILQSVFTIIGILIMMITISLSMTGVAILVLPVSMIFIVSVIKVSQKYFMAQQRVLGEINGHIEETYSGDLVVKSFNMQNAEIEKFDKINNELYRHSWKSQFLSGLMMPIINVINNLGYIGICVLGANLVIKGRMSIGDIQAFIQYTNQFSQPIAQAANMMNMIQGTVASAERVFEILDEEEESLDTENPVKIDLVRGNIICDNVEFSYSKDEKLIENWSLDVKPGQTVAIVGPTGAGKTTIVNLLMKFYDIQGGDIKIDNVSIKDMTRLDIRKMFAMVLQDTWLFNGTIRENLRYSKQDATDSEVEQAAYLAHADHFIRALPGGYEFVLNEEANNISQGQKQLLTIARAILANAPILILDEATSNVDTRTEELIQKAMNKLMQGRTSFVIAHRLSTIKNADVIIVMDHGRIVERGNHDELLEKDGYYSKLYNSQFSEEIA